MIFIKVVILVTHWEKKLDLRMGIFHFNSYTSQFVLSETLSYKNLALTLSSRVIHLNKFQSLDFDISFIFLINFSPIFWPLYSGSTNRSSRKPMSCPPQRTWHSPIMSKPNYIAIHFIDQTINFMIFIMQPIPYRLENFIIHFYFIKICISSIKFPIALYLLVEFP